MREGDLSQHEEFLKHVDLLIARDFDGAITCLSNIYSEMRVNGDRETSQVAYLERRIARVHAQANRFDEAASWIEKSLKTDAACMLTACLGAELMATLPDRTAKAIEICLLALSKHEMGLIANETATVQSVDYVQRTRDLLSELNHPDRAPNSGNGAGA